jgi:formylglycine-generating enzyme
VLTAAVQASRYSDQLPRRSPSGALGRQWTKQARLLGAAAGGVELDSTSRCTHRGRVALLIWCITLLTAVTACSIRTRDGTDAPEVDPYRVEGKAPDGRWRRIRHVASEISLRYVAHQTFTSGSPTTEVGRNSDETYCAREVSGFYLAETEVTVGQWQRFADLSGYKTDAERGVAWNDIRHGGFTLSSSGEIWRGEQCATWRNPLPSRGHKPTDDCPVVMVSWNDAMAFCSYWGFTLPSEAQWECACRAGSLTRFPWGEGAADSVEHANFLDASAREWSVRDTPSASDGFAWAAAVASLRPNRWGYYDMIGNVAEWCADGYWATYVQSGSDLTVPMTFGAVVRGGSWASRISDCRCATRDWLPPHGRDARVGFRVALIVR